MGKVKEYIKRGIKYILKEHNQPIIKIEVVQKTPTKEFEDKIFIITGGGSGIGYSIAEKLIKEKAKVIITGRNEEKLKNAKLKLGDNCEFFVLDITQISEFDSFFGEIYAKYKRIDGIINNAGISLHEWDFMKVDELKYDLQFNTNLKGSYFFTQNYIKYYEMNNQKNAKILFISSERGTYCDDLPYGLTKVSINSLMQALSFKYYKKGININTISPGITASDMTGIDKFNDLSSNQNSGRFFVPEEIAEVAMFLLSDFSKCISGEVIHTNGGNHLRRGY